MRPACARMPVVAIAIDLMKSIMARKLRTVATMPPYDLPTAVLINVRLWV